MNVVAFNGSPRKNGNTSIFFTISQMIIPGSRYWNMGFGREKGEVNDDAEGLEIMQTLGENMAWLDKIAD